MENFFVPTVLEPHAPLTANPGTPLFVSQTYILSNDPCAKPTVDGNVYRSRWQWEWI